MITKLKKFEFRMSDQEIHAICKEYRIKGYDINPDGSISVDRSVRLSSRSLKRIPLVFKEVSGSFYCYDNQLTSLRGCPSARGIYCFNNQITSFEEIPEFWEGELNIFSNPVDEIFKLFNRDIRCIDLINEFDVIQGNNKVSRDRLEEVFVHLDMKMSKDIKLINYKLI